MARSNIVMGTSRTGTPTLPAPKKQLPTIYYGCGPEIYVRLRFAEDYQGASLLDRVLNTYAESLADRDGIDVRNAFVRVLESLRSIPVLERWPATSVQFIVELAVRKHVIPDVDAVRRFLTHIYRAFEETWAGMDDETQIDLFWRRLWCVVGMFKDHLGCGTPAVGRPTEAPFPADTVIRALTMWGEVNPLVPPCRYLRLERALDGRGVPWDAAHAVLRKHGANVLDDLAELVGSGNLTEDDLHAMAAADALPHDLNAPIEPTVGIPGINRLAAAIDYAYPAWRMDELDLRSSQRAGLFERNHPPRGGWYRPALSDPEAHAILTEIERRFGVHGTALDLLAQRVLRAFGRGMSPQTLLLAVDLHAYWRGTVPAAECVRAAKAATDRRFPPVSAFELFLACGPNHLERLVDAMEDGCVGVPEANRFFRSAKGPLTRGERMNALLAS